jgi:hypothetical protein
MTLHRTTTSAWFGQFTTTAVLHVKNRLGQCSSLRFFKDELAGLAVKAVSNVLEEIEKQPSKGEAYRSSADPAKRWFHQKAYLASLPVALNFEPISAQFRLLDGAPQLMLHCCYVDQLPWHETAKVLGIKSAQVTVDLRSAYERLCNRLQKYFPSPEFTPGRIVTYPLVFPEPPILSSWIQQEQYK